MLTELGNVLTETKTPVGRVQEDLPYIGKF